MNKHELHSSSPLYPGWGSKYSVSWRTAEILHAADGAVILAVRLLELYPVPLSWKEKGRFKGICTGAKAVMLLPKPEVWMGSQLHK